MRLQNFKSTVRRGIQMVKIARAAAGARRADAATKHVAQQALAHLLADARGMPMKVGQYLATLPGNTAFAPLTESIDPVPVAAAATTIESLTTWVKLIANDALLPLSMCQASWFRRSSQNCAAKASWCSHGKMASGWPIWQAGQPPTDGPWGSRWLRPCSEVCSWQVRFTPILTRATTCSARTHKGDRVWCCWTTAVPLPSPSRHVGRS